MYFYGRNRIKEKEVWHKWFAWHPVRIKITPDGDSKKVWLEYVYRCGVYECSWGDCYWQWSYK